MIRFIHERHFNLMRGEAKSGAPPPPPKGGNPKSGYGGGLAWWSVRLDCAWSVWWGWGKAKTAMQKATQIMFRNSFAHVIYHNGV